MVKQSGNTVSTVITIIFVVVVVVFVVLMVRGNQHPKVVSDQIPRASASETLNPGRSEIVVTVQDATPDPGASEASPIDEGSKFVFPQEVTMEMVSEMVGNPDGGVTLLLNSGQRLIVSAAEMDKLDPSIKLYSEYNREQR